MYYSAERACFRRSAARDGARRVCWEPVEASVSAQVGGSRANWEDRAVLF